MSSVHIYASWSTQSFHQQGIPSFSWAQSQMAHLCCHIQNSYWYAAVSGIYSHNVLSTRYVLDYLHTHQDLGIDICITGMFHQKVNTGCRYLGCTDAPFE